MMQNMTFPKNEPSPGGNHHLSRQVHPGGPILRFSTAMPLDNKTNHGSLETLARARNSHARYVGTLAVNVP